MRKHKKHLPVFGKRLTEREIAVITLFWQGRSSTEVADILFISKRTVDSYANATYVKLGAHGRLDACNKAISLGIIVLPERTDYLAGSREPRLTKREKEVLKLVARGLGNKQVAEVFGVKDGTVSFHLGSINDKLQTMNRIQAVRTAIRLGLIPGDSLTQKVHAE
ncbi:MAG: LuxR C-terminal-related transcriptional regulator [Candidatus Berkelbacteria bacterium]|nr:LuxR C-terminal-related transcriptional regulator [Candidatus Berkelbacteria bacterium]